MILHSCQRHAVLPYIRGLHRMISLHGKIWFYPRNVMFSKKCCIRHILEGLKRNVRGHAETCLLIIFSSRGCAVFSPIFLSNFLGGCPNRTMRKSKKHAHLDDIQRCGWVGMGWPFMVWDNGKGRTEQQNAHRSRLGAKTMIHPCKMRKPRKPKKTNKTKKPDLWPKVYT